MIKRNANESEEFIEGKEKKCANESSESRTKRLAIQSQYQRQKIANKLA